MRGYCLYVSRLIKWVQFFFPFFLKRFVHSFSFNYTDRLFHLSCFNILYEFLIFYRTLLFFLFLQYPQHLNILVSANASHCRFRKYFEFLLFAFGIFFDITFSFYLILCYIFLWFYFYFYMLLMSLRKIMLLCQSPPQRWIVFKVPKLLLF